MASTFLEVIGIAAARDQQQIHHFTTVIDGPTGKVEMPTCADALLDYHTFQREVLLRTGFMYRHMECEGVEGVTASTRWKAIVQDVLLRTRQAQTEAQTPPLEQGGTMLN